MKLNKKRLPSLLNICKTYQGRYLDSSHGSGSWATEYSGEFTDAVTEIYHIVKDAPANNHAYTLTKMQKLFNEKKIRSCRTNWMSLDSVKYLYNEYVDLKSGWLPKVIKNNSKLMVKI